MNSIKKVNPRVKALLTESILIQQAILQDENTLNTVQDIVDVMTIAIKADKKILFCGNGNSHIVAEHLSIDLANGSYKDRTPVYAEVLQGNTSSYSRTIEDFGYNELFARSIKAKGKTGDILISFSNNGNDLNILKAIDEAKFRNMLVLGFSAGNAGKMKNSCDYLLTVPSNDLKRIQEAHLMLGHMICELVEASIF